MEGHTCGLRTTGAWQAPSSCQEVPWLHPLCWGEHLPLALPAGAAGEGEDCLGCPLLLRHGPLCSSPSPTKSEDNPLETA